MASLTPARMSYAAAIVGCVTFGCYFVLAAICIHFLLKKNRRSSKGQHVVLAYTCLMLVVNIIYFVAASKWSEIEFVESTENPAIFAAQLSTNYAIIKDTAYTINIWLADSLMLYRTYIIWRSIPVLLFPALVYLGALASGLGLLIETGQPGGTFGVGLVVPFGTAFWSISVALNVILTFLISYKLLHQHRRVRSLRVTEVGDRYTDIVAILVESAALYSISGLIYIPLFALNIPLQYPFAALLGSAAGIAPNLIIFRIAMGVDFKGETMQQASSVQFATRALARHGATFTNPESTLNQNSTTGSAKTTKILGDSSPNLEVYPLDSMKT
ncbi:hypothetical protein DFH07DRAFT_385330 [Mycena maculata]|uniref:Uncharacterized protein n=1 Tax=Mycena maculata TaxID=230809 RepID=A0AAD7KAE5_9AGAR|nr:hypothetical protein DFH07DRAFT_385330 [Mycena maculata]